MDRLTYVLIIVAVALVVIKTYDLTQPVIISHPKTLIEPSISEPSMASQDVKLKLTSKSVTFDQRNATHSIYSDYATFASLFADAGFKVSATEDKTDVLVVQSDRYTEEETAMILERTSKGMTLIMVGDRGSGINRLAINLGIAFYPDYIYDLHNYQTVYKNIIISDFSNHSLTDSLQRIVLYESCSLDMFKDAITLAAANESAKSSFRRDSKFAVLATSKFEAGKIFAICDGDIFTNRNIRDFDNIILAKNLINWAA